jgi:hypothetical protein
VQLPVGERLTVGYAQSRGRGRVIVLGLAPSAELMVELHAWLGVRVACRARSGQRVTSALFRRGAMLVVVVTNTGQDDRDVVLDLDGEMDDQLRASRDLRTGVVAPVVGGSVLARVPARSGTVLELS